MSLRVVWRKQTGALTISGHVRHKNGRVSDRIQRRAFSNDWARAEKEAAFLEAEILRDLSRPVEQKEMAQMQEDRPIMNDLEVLEHILEQLNSLRADVAALRADVLSGHNRLEKRLNGLDDRLLQHQADLDASFRISTPRRMIEP